MNLSEASASRKTFRGFTLVESLVAVSILAIAIAGPLVTASTAYNAARLAREQLTALSLAQEGLEYIRMMRDNDYLSAYQANQSSSVAWTNFITGSMNYCVYTNFVGAAVGAVLCTLDPTLTPGVVDPMSPSGPARALKPCTLGGSLGSYPTTLPACTPLYTGNNGTAVIYSQDSTSLSDAKQTIYTRTVQISSTGITGFANVVSRVSWVSKGITYSVQLVNSLSAWQ